MNATLTQPRTAPVVELTGFKAGDQTAVLIDGVAYWVRVTAAGLEFAREDTGARHEVRVVRGVGVGCSCPDAKYRRRACKHTLAAAEVWREVW